MASDSNGPRTKVAAEAAVCRSSCVRAGGGRSGHGAAAGSPRLKESVDAGGRGRRGRGDDEGGDGGGRKPSEGKLRWKIQQLEKEKLEIMSNHNQEVCGLQVEVGRLRAEVERSEAHRAELQYNLSVSHRDGDRAAERVCELQKVLEASLRAREEDQHALQQEVEERDKEIQSFNTESQKLHRMLQDQEEALEESERRMMEVQKEREKEAELNRRQEAELKEGEERRRRDKERVKSLESNIEAERTAHLETKFTCEIIQLRVRDLEAALAAARCGQQEAQRGLEMLRGRLREAERAHGEERDGSERALQRLQKEHEQCKSDLSVALETERRTTFDLTEKLKEEERRIKNTHTQLEQAAQRQQKMEEALRDTLTHYTHTLRQHTHTECSPPAKDCGSCGPPAEVLELLKTTLNSWKHRLETTHTQVQDLLSGSERLCEEKQTLHQLISDQNQQLQESQQVSIKLKQEVTRLLQESSDWSTRSRCLQAELEKEREEREREMEGKEREMEEKEREMEKEREEREREMEGKEREMEKEREEREREMEEKEREMEKEREEREREMEEKEREMEKERERKMEEKEREMEKEREEREREMEEKEREMEKEREERTAEVQKITEKYQKESKAQLSFLYQIYQRLLAGCVLLDQPQSILGNFTWQELCDVINEQVDQMTSDLRKANDKIAHLQSVCVREQECVLSQLEECVRRREEAWSSQHTHTVTQLEVCRSQVSSLTSASSRLQGLLLGARREAGCFLSACALLAGALKHTHGRLKMLSAQKTLICRQLAEREEVEEQVRRLTAALGGEEEEEREEKGEKKRRGRVRGRWRRSVCVIMAVRRWRKMAEKTTELFRVETKAGNVAVSVCGGSTTATRKGQIASKGVCFRWLRSKRLSSAILSSMADLQEKLTHTGPAPPDVMSSAQSALSRLLDQLLDQSDAADLIPCDQNTRSKALVLALQQHFLVFSQRLHSAEVERRSLRMEVANLKRGHTHTQRFSSVCVELREALSREQEAQTLIQEQTDRQHTLSHSLSEAQQEVSRKERSLRILGNHLSGVQRERKQQEETLKHLKNEVKEAARRRECVISSMKAAETSCKELRESLVQSRRSPVTQPRPLSLPWQQLELSGAESIMGAPEVAACQSLLSAFSQLCSVIGWPDQEVSAHSSHVTGQDARLRGNQASVAEFPETFLLADVEAPQPDLLSDWPKVALSPAPCLPVSKPPTPDRKTRKSRGRKRQTDRK